MDALALISNDVNDMKVGLHGGVGVSTVTSQREGSRFDPHLGPFCVEFACGFSPGTPASSHRPKTCMLG